MPTYDYICDQCHHEEEVFQKITEEPLTVCPSCKAAAFRRALSASRFHLKGSGFYANDYCKKPASGSAPSCSCIGEHNHP